MLVLDLELFSVNFSTMTKVNDPNLELGFLNFVDDPKVTNPNPPRIATDQLFRARGMGFGFQAFDGLNQAVLKGWRNFFKGFERGFREQNLESQGRLLGKGIQGGFQRHEPLRLSLSRIKSPDVV